MRQAGQGRVVGIGQCAFDIIGPVADYPQVDEKAELHDVIFEGGGPVATALVTLARLGIETAIASRIGGDLFGERIRDGLLTEGVDCTHLYCDSAGSSQLAFIAVDASGRRTIFWTRGSARPLSAAEFEPGWLDGAAVLHLDGLHHDVALAAATSARARGVTTVLDGGTLRDGSLQLLELIDHPVVSEKFARQLCGEASIEAMLDRLLEFGGAAASITCGERGSWSREREGVVLHQPAFAVATVDTTGCGDVFHGGYIYGLLQGLSLAETVRFAAACAALKARAYGGRKGIANIDEVMSIASKQKNI